MSKLWVYIKVTYGELSKNELLTDALICFNQLLLSTKS